MGKRDTGKRETGKRAAGGPEPDKRDPAAGDPRVRRQAVIDGLLADALRPASMERLPSHDALAADIRRAIDALLAKAEAQRSRCLTYDDLEEALPPRDVSADDLEAIFWILAEHGIEIEDGEA